MTGSLHTEVHGDPGRPALILLHGGGAASRTWKQQFSGLADRYHLLAPDLPGFGRSPGPVSLDAATEAVAALVERVGPAHLCGYSMGAFVAARVAADRPESIRRLILCAGNVKPAESGRRQMAFYRSRRGWWLMKVFSDLPNRSALLRMVDEVERTDLTDVLPRIQAPTLVLCGRRDRGCLADTQPIADAIANSTPLIVPHVGHSFPVTQPKVFNTIVHGFLAGVPEP
ncbi:alpha/beta fold hydrolase [Actinospica robiniae]|uniref:alpha/beta fold hydrolase n=1 Tax=Actinospica robiniae TaxID=304901 RepID=UPI00146F9825|nr:alpha/beta hydrolase [Actinospica robiniae]